VHSNFSATNSACAAPRRGGPDTWLNSDMIASYEELHELGYGHSIETYEADQLAGGLYGIQLGQVFFGESMFSLRRDASKVALARLVDECRARDITWPRWGLASSRALSLWRCCGAMRGGSRAEVGQPRPLKLLYQGALCTMRPVSRIP
jgi:hypothetical protein